MTRRTEEARMRKFLPQLILVALAALVVLSVGGVSVSSAVQSTPGLVFSTYLGSEALDAPFASAVDRQGNIYIAGTTESPDFPTKAAFQARYGGGTGDGFVAKFSPTGELLFSTFLGGISTDTVGAITVDANGNIYVAGYTDSYDFPVKNPLQPQGRNVSTFIARFDASGRNLVYSTHITDGSGARAMAVDSTGNLYVTGPVGGRGFQPINAFQPNHSGGGQEAYVLKLNPEGSRILYSSYLGGSRADTTCCIAVDREQNVYVAGNTTSSDFPTVSPFQPNLVLVEYGSFGEREPDAFISKINAQGTALLYSTYLGGNGSDAVSGLAVDAEGQVYAGGYTSSTDFPGAGRDTKPAHEGFVTVLGSTGRELLFSTYFGGRASDSVSEILLDAGGNLYIGGTTSSDDLPVLRGMQPRYGGGVWDAFVARYRREDQSGKLWSLDFSSYFGGSGFERLHALQLDRNNLILIGDTNSTDLPTRNPYQSTHKGELDAFVTRLEVPPGSGAQPARPTLLTDPVPDPRQAGVRWFEPTGHTLRGAFLEYWTRYGGLEQFGYPITEEFFEPVGPENKQYRVQYFERVRFEHHPENVGTPYEVLLGTLGREFRQQDPPASPVSGATYFRETGHNLSGAFKQYWDARGGLFVHGFPITEALMEKSTDGKEYLVQWFERSRFELHPQNKPPYDVLLGLLGRQLSEKKGYAYGGYPLFGRAGDWAWVAGDLTANQPCVICSCLACGCVTLRYDNQSNAGVQMLDPSVKVHERYYPIDLLSEPRYNPYLQTVKLVLTGRATRENEEYARCPIARAAPGYLVEGVQTNPNQ
jgi:hypothetical protein